MSSLGVLVLQWLIWYYPCAKSGGAPLIERLRLDRVHGIVRKAEMVAHLMHQHMGDERFQAFPAFSPFIEDRATVEVDHVRQASRKIDRFVAHRTAAVEAQYVAGRFQVNLRDNFGIRKLHHPPHHAVPIPTDDTPQADDR